MTTVSGLGNSKRQVRQRTGTDSVSRKATKLQQLTGSAQLPDGVDLSTMGSKRDTLNTQGVAYDNAWADWNLAREANKTAIKTAAIAAVGANHITPTQAVKEFYCSLTDFPS